MWRVETIRPLMPFRYLLSGGSLAPPVDAGLELPGVESPGGGGRSGDAAPRDVRAGRARAP